MPELPDVALYIARLDAKLTGQVLRRVRLASPFLLHTFEPPLSAASGCTVNGFERIGKRIVFALDGDLFMVLHLMIAGRLRWREPGAPVPKKVGLAAFDFDIGALILTEAGTKRRASLHLVRGRGGLSDFDRGGIEPLSASLEAFRAALGRENRTLKRALTDPRLLSGVGNAYSDEILFAARLSPVKRTQSLSDDEWKRLHASTRETLADWSARLAREVADGFPEKVTAFRSEMAVHGKYKSPCPRCGTSVQRIRHADNEINYCPRCQTGGRVLADRSLSRLLKGDWPKNIEDLEELEQRRTPPKERQK